MKEEEEQEWVCRHFCKEIEASGPCIWPGQAVSNQIWPSFESQTVEVRSTIATPNRSSKSFLIRKEKNWTKKSYLILIFMINLLFRPLYHPTYDAFPLGVSKTTSARNLNLEHYSFLLKKIFRYVTLVCHLLAL